MQAHAIASIDRVHHYLQPTHEHVALPCHSLLRPACSLRTVQPKYQDCMYLKFKLPLNPRYRVLTQPYTRHAHQPAFACMQGLTHLTRHSESNLTTLMSQGAAPVKDMYDPKRHIQRKAPLTQDHLHVQHWHTARAPGVLHSKGKKSHTEDA